MLLLLLLGASVAAVTGASAAAAAPAFVQARSSEITTGTTNSLAFVSGNTGGNLIVVTVVWNNTGAVSLSDTRGNTYTSVAARQTWNASWSEQTFVAKNVSAGANTVTARFTTAISAFGTVYLHEYSGVDRTNPVDVQRSATGNSAAMSSGAITTTVPGDLLFAAAASKGTVTAAGSGWTTRSTSFGNRTQDRLAGVAGSYTASATQNSNRWVLHLIAFRPEASTDTSAPSVPAGLSANAFSATTVNLSWVASTDNVGVTGYRIYRDGVVVTTSPTNAYSDAGLTAATTYAYRVSALDAAGNESAQSDAVTVTTQAPPSDTTPPSVSVSAPSAGTTVTGNVSVAATASDDVGVAGVQFLLDGNALGTEDTTSPYGVVWDTTTATNGPHSLTARARDAAGNSRTSTVSSVIVDNSVPPPNALLAGYAFEEGAGTSAADASGHDLAATLLGGAGWGVGKNGSALSLNGSSFQYADLGDPASLRLTGSMTISGWIYSTAFPATTPPIVSKRGIVGLPTRHDDRHGAHARSGSS